MLLLAFVFLPALAAGAPAGMTALSAKALHGVLPAELLPQAAATVCPRPSSPLPSQLTYVGQASGRFSENLTLAALLTDGSGNALANRSLTFVLGSQSLIATTNANGVAQVITTAPAGQLALTISFAGDGAFAASIASAAITVAPEPSTIAYTGSVFLGNNISQPVSALLTDSLQRPIANESVLFSLGGISATAVTNAQGVAAAVLSLSSVASGSGQLTVSFAGDTHYAASQQVVSVVAYQATNYVVWGGNNGGLQLGQTVNFVGRHWARQVKEGNYSAGDDFRGVASSVSAFQPCENTGDGDRDDQFCWATRHDHDRGYAANALPPYIGVIVATSIQQRWDSIHGNIAALAVCKVLPQSSTNRTGSGDDNDGDRDDRLVSRNCVLASVIADAEHIFAPSTAPVMLAQSQPATVLPNQSFTVGVLVTNQWKFAPVQQVALNESFAGSAPATASTNLSTIAPGATVSFAAPETVAALTPRQASESSSAYETRLGSLEGSSVTSAGIVSFSDAAGSPYLPVRASSASQIQIPRLSLGLSAPTCGITGYPLAFQASVVNIGMAGASAAMLSITLPDGSTQQAAVPALTPGAGTTFSFNFTPNKAGIFSATAALTWIDAAQNTYGPISAVASINVAPPPSVPTTLTLLPSQAGPDMISSASQSLTATLLDQNGKPMANQVITLTITGANATVLTATTNSAGSATFTYNGTNAGTDTAVASVTTGGTSLQSNVATTALQSSTAQSSNSALQSNHCTIKWIAPAPTTLALSPSQAGPDPTLTSQSFTATVTDQIGRPMANQLITLTITGVNANTLTATTGSTGSATFAYSGANPGTDAITASVASGGSSLQSNSVTISWIQIPTTLTLSPAQAGSDMISSASQSLTATLSDQNGKPMANQIVTLTITGANATILTATTNSAGTATFAYTGANAGTDTVTASVTASGTTLQSNRAAITWIAPAPTTLVLSPSQAGPDPTLTSQSFTATVTDQIGRPMANQLVTLTITGVNASVLTATTDSTGSASFAYSGANPGTDTITASVASGGSSLQSNSASVSWIQIPTALTLSPSQAGPDLIFTASQSLAATLTDQNGKPIANQVITLTITGANTAVLTASTNSAGSATFTYTGANAGADTAIAAVASGGNSLQSNSATITWKVPLTTSAGPNQSVTISPAGTLPVAPQLISLETSMNQAAGIDYSQSTNQLLLSLNSSSAAPRNFELLSSDGTSAAFSTITGLSAAQPITVARNDGGGTSQGGFSAGTVFAGSSAPGAIISISADGSTVQNPWVILPGETGAIKGLYIDRSGAFAGNLVATTSTGNVWQVTSAAVPTLLARTGAALQGLTTVPNDPAYGPFAGKVVVGGGSTSPIIAIDAQGNSLKYSLGMTPVFLQSVNANENFYGIDSQAGVLWGIPAPELSGMVGDILAGEASGKLWQIHWTGTQFEATQFAQANSWASATTAPAGLGSVLSTSATATLQGSVSEQSLPPGGVLTSTWTQISGPGTVTFSAPNQSVTSVTLSQPGTYVLRLTGSDSTNTATSDVTVTVAGNAAPIITAGGDQQINFPSPASLNDSVADDGLPSGVIYNFWKAIGPNTVTLSPQPYDASAAFSLTSNPNGVWSYGWESKLGQPLNLYTATGQTPIDFWEITPGTIPYVVFNSTNTPISPSGSTEWPSGTLALHPGPTGQPSVVRWTAPATGAYLVQGRFFAGDTTQTGTNVAILLNSSATILSQGINGPEVLPGSGAGVPFNFVENVNAGDTLDFAVGFGVSGSSFANTSLLVTITPNSNPAITASFGLPGNYALRHIAYDGALFSQQDTNLNVQAVCVPPPSGIVGWWPGEDNAADIVGGDTGTIQGGVTFGPGEVGQAFDFPGSSADIFIPASGALHNPSFTEEAWILLGNYSAQHPILEFNNNGSIGVHMWANENAPGGTVVPGALYANLIDTGGNWHVLGTPANVLAQGQWSHIALTYDQASGQGSIYVNGALVTSSNLGTFTPLNSTPLYIGTRPGTSAWYAGKIDEVSIFNRALSAQEIQSIYLAQTAGKCKP